MSTIKNKLKEKILRPALQKIGCGFLSSVGLEHVDMQLVSILKWKKNGFFIEAGANDGIRQSNTYYFEKVLRWNGLLVEPIPGQAEKCRKNRSNSKVVNAALVRHDYPSETVRIEMADLMSVVNDGNIEPALVESHVARGREVQHLEQQNSINIKATTLTKLLNDLKVRHVDFFSLDVEGYETEVLRGIDFSTITFDFIFVETRIENEEEIDSILTQANMKMTHQWLNPSYSNRLYARVEN